MGKELSEMTQEKLRELFPIILKEHNTDYKKWYEIEKRKLLSCFDEKSIMRISHIEVGGLPTKRGKHTLSKF
jgi:hypothetical protein